ncbi:MAG: S8 family serine peptidase [Actinophytocola sp.]|nr:S8 family serine peptidase [Actinophytocola sp.]
MEAFVTLLRSRRGLAGVAVAAAAAVALGITLTANATPEPTATGSASSNVSTDAARTTAADKTSAIVTLAGDPLSTSARSAPRRGEKVDFAAAAVRSERAKLAAKRDAFRSWLSKNAAGARVSDEFDIALNAVAVELRGASLGQLSQAPGVKDVRYATRYRLLDETDPGLNLINAIDAWQSARVGGPENAGKGVKVGVIDSGVDQNHPCFDDAGYPVTPQLGDTRFTNNKVIVAKVFNSDSTQTPEAIGGHGTHVAGTVACNLDTPANVHGATAPYEVSGVAPFAQIGNYNVFPGEVPTVSDADLLEAMEAAYTDGMDVINMSLGGAIGRGPDPLADAVDNLDKANLVSAIAAGNSGPGARTIQSPGVAERGLTAGASTVGHFVGNAVTAGERTLHAATGDFPVFDSDFTAPLGVVSGADNGLSLACAPLDTDLTGKIAVVSRGECSFSTKMRHAQDAGAVAAFVVNNVAGDPISMGLDDSVTPAPTIPAYMFGPADADALIAADGESTTISAEANYFRTANDNIMAAFSSGGPSPDAAARVKPDVVAPGVNVLSGIPVNHCGDGASDCWTFMQGTSMASPHLAGMAAVLRAAHPTLTAEQVRSAVVNTSTDGVVTAYTDGTSVVSDVNVAGAGLADLAAAVDATVAVGPVSTSFGTLKGAKATTATVTLTSLTGAEQTLTLSVDSLIGDGVAFSAPQEVTLPAVGSVDIEVSASAARGEHASGGRSAMLRFFDGDTEIAHSVLFATLR